MIEKTSRCSARGEVQEQSTGADFEPAIELVLESSESLKSLSLMLFLCSSIMDFQYYNRFYLPALIISRRYLPALIIFVIINWCIRPSFGYCYIATATGGV